MTKPELNDLISRLNLIAVLDHSGRAGNGFFLTIFDQHPEVVSCPWMHYIYSYIITAFGSEEVLDSKKAHALATQKAYFKYVYNDLDEQRSAELYKMGGDPSSFIDRKEVRRVFDQFVLSDPSVTRKKLVLSIYLSFAIGSGRDISRLKYILVSDAVSLRSENVMGAFSGAAIIAMKKDFDDAKLVSLVRDPRANFASNRHQYVNSFGNMYDIRPGNYFKQLFILIGKKIRSESNCVYLFWLCYFASTARTIFRFKIKYFDNFMTVKNENLNLNFVPAINKVIQWLDVSFYDPWKDPDYHPTIVGVPWAGTGAYNNRYQKNLTGRLENDAPEVSRKVAGPNRYVTERWKTRMSRNEIYIVEKLFCQEMGAMNYEFMYYKPGDDKSVFSVQVWRPYLGELPSFSWVFKATGLGWKEMFNRIFYSFTFVPFYIVSRLVLLNIVRRGFFDNSFINEYTAIKQRSTQPAVI